MLDLTAQQAALAFLVLVTPICVWVTYTDLKFMKIFNWQTDLLAVLFVVAGLLLLPFDVYLWRLSHFFVLLAIGFVLNAIAGFGAGDAKFMAAAAPFFAHTPESVILAVLLLSSFLLGAFATHRLARMVPALRAMAPDWVSWTRRDFPMGLALVGTLWTYLALIAFG